jgi:UDP-2,4-diacetamido-2,4,6-trideoxy-beta-L-altropyranose hydrolase
MNGIVIRCDGSGVVGFGHVSRCLSLAEALREQGVRPTFAMRALDETFVAPVRAARFPVVLIPHSAPVSDRLGAEDATAVREAAAASGASAVVVDHYGADEAYFADLRSSGLGLGVVDDTGERDLATADWVLNQNLGAEDHARPRHGRPTLAGPEYALLRPEFARARERMSRTFAPDDRRVIVTLGGGDVAEATASVLDELESVEMDLDIRVLARRRLQIPRRSRHSLSVLQDPRDVPDHMAWADVSVNAGGSTSWELACLAVPMVVLSFSPDQEQNAVALQRERVAVRPRDEGHGGLAQTVRTLLGDAPLRRGMSSRAAALVDGKGAGRAARSLIETFSTQRSRA